MAVCIKFLIPVLQLRKQRLSKIKYCDQDSITNKGESQKSNPDLSWFSFLYILLSRDISKLK